MTLHADWRRDREEKVTSKEGGGGCGRKDGAGEGYLKESCAVDREQKKVDRKHVRCPRASTTHAGKVERRKLTHTDYL